LLDGDTLRSVSPAGIRCHFVLLDKDESCPTADLSNIGRSNGPAYSTGEWLNTLRIVSISCGLQVWLHRESREAAFITSKCDEFIRRCCTAVTMAASDITAGCVVDAVDCRLGDSLL